MEKQDLEETTVMLESCQGCKSERSQCTDDSQEDPIYETRAISRRRKRCEVFMQKVASWFQFGMLCLLIGGLVGYWVRGHLGTGDKQFDDFRHYDTQNARLEEQNTFINSPAELYQEQNGHSSHGQNHVSSTHDRLDENEPLGTAIREILENMTGTRGLSDLQLKKVVNLTKDKSDKVYLSVGMRNDYLLQACGEKNLKQSFPDIDYALFGYNTLTGFPLAVGHDPGFTMPIFKADYSTGEQSGDCRFSVPKGLVIVPDVSCETSFTSEVIQSQRSFSNSLAALAAVDGKVYGASFSLSAGYKKAQSELENKKKVYILSVAKCDYYFSKLLTSNAPEFDPNFLHWVRKLEFTPDEGTFMKFFETYGTHFPTEVTFGARYTNEHSMDTEEFDHKKSQGLNIAMAAGYSGLIGIGVNAKFRLDSDQQKQAKSFSEKTETRSFTVGAAPPADGDAMKWASSVQNNPIPVSYKVSPIENLFTADFMRHLDVDYTSVLKNVLKYKPLFDAYLKRKALIVDCQRPGFTYTILDNTRLLHPKFNRHFTRGFSVSDCLKECSNDPKCKAVSYGPELCHGYHGQSTDHHLLGNAVKNWTTYVIRRNANATIVMNRTEINGTHFKETATKSLAQCHELCLQEDKCFALSEDRDTCKLFEESAAKSVFENTKQKTIFVAKCAHLDIVFSRDDWKS